MTWFDFFTLVFLYIVCGIWSTIFIIDICNDTYDALTNKIVLPIWVKVILWFTAVIWPIHLVICLVCLLIMFVSLIIDGVKLHKAIKEYRKNSEQNKDVKHE